MRSPLAEANALQIHMGEDFYRLDPLIQTAHSGEIHLEGDVDVRRGRGLAALICHLQGMPAAGDSVRLQVHGSHYADAMLWRRDFAGRQLQSNFTLQGDFLVEKMGPLRLYLKLVARAGALVYQLSHVKYHGVRLPRWLSPSLAASEKSERGRYIFTVRVSMPLLGLLIQYAGALTLIADV